MFVELLKVKQIPKSATPEEAAILKMLSSRFTPPLPTKTNRSKAYQYVMTGHSDLLHMETNTSTDELSEYNVLKHFVEHATCTAVHTTLCSPCTSQASHLLTSIAATSAPTIVSAEGNFRSML